MKELEEMNLENVTVKDLSILDIMPLDINGVTIEIRDDRRHLVLPIGMSGDNFRTWKKKRGGVFLHDLRSFRMGENSGKYVIIEGVGIEGDHYKKIVRLIELDEMDEFESAKLVQGYLGDKFYMELCDLSENGMGTHRYIEEIEELEDEEDPDYVALPVVPSAPLEDEENSEHNIPLFE